MDTKNIKITNEALGLLQNLKKKHELKTYDNAIKKMCLFFVENCVSPNAKISKNIEAHIKKLHADYVKRDDSFRKWIGMIYHKEIFMLIDDQKKILKDIRELTQFLKENEGKKLVAEFAKEYITEQKKHLDGLVNNKDYFETRDRINLLIGDINRRDKIIKEQRQELDNIKSKLEYVLGLADEENDNGKILYTIKLSKMTLETLEKVLKN